MGHLDAQETHSLVVLVGALLQQAGDDGAVAHVGGPVQRRALYWLETLSGSQLTNQVCVLHADIRVTLK